MPEVCRSTRKDAYESLILQESSKRYELRVDYHYQQPMAMAPSLVLGWGLAGVTKCVIMAGRGVLDALDRQKVKSEEVCPCLTSVNVPST